MRSRKHNGRSVRPLAVGMALTAAAGHLHAQDSGYYVSAPVLSVDPIVTEKLIERPIQHCTEYQPPAHQYRAHDARRHGGSDKRLMPSLLGGIIGGLVGNQFGGGSGKKILTVVGALAGSSIANDIAAERRAHRAYAHPQRRCHTTYERDSVETVDGYHVVYEYAGQTFSKRVAEHPGETIRVRVRAEIAES